MNEKIAVVIPCFKARDYILKVLGDIGPEVSRIYVIDDQCPQHTGQHVREKCNDPRVSIIKNETNQGVGGAVIAGYRQALQEGADIIVKMDADGQMDPRMLPKLVKPIIDHRADYTKGNRFYDVGQLSSMPKHRLFGNAVLSLFSKLSSGYWDIMDPTNGYTAIHAKILKLLPLNKIARRYFFESDMLFRLNTVRAVVMDIPMQAKYTDEYSSLNVWHVLLEFPLKHLVCLLKRLFYNYFLREFNIATIELMAGTLLFVSGAAYGAHKWYSNALSGITTPSGTVMVAALPVLLGFQLLLSALNYDINNVPKKCIHEFL